jgi:uncharacterized membrane protein
MSKSRLETFSDGVFAIAITLLVLTIAQPGNYHRLTHQLEQKWPSLAAYVVSFVVIGIMWLNHHTIFEHLQRVDRKFFYFNLALLMTIAFLPYPTGVLGQALGKGQGATTAAAFYSITMVVNACCWAGLWLYASSGRRLLTTDFPEDQRARLSVLFTAGGAVYAIAVGIAFLSPYACLAFNAALAVYYAFDPLSRGTARRGALELDPRDPQPG